MSKTAPGSRKRGTSTSNFGTGKRESHDASAFYNRFDVPVISNGETVEPPVAVDKIFLGDASQMSIDQVADGSVALVVTSPPYFAGKEYEEALGEGHIPESYKTYLEMLRDVFAKCADKLEDGGRMAINVANLGRRPYRSLSSDIITILQEDLHLLLRGEIIWKKAQGASGSCAWGSFQSAVNPVIRDLTERVIIASKGRFDRAVPRTKREQEGLPSTVSLFKDDFMEWTTDVWEFPPESATRVNHPAPFPVELPQRLIDLYTFEDDLVLDPFMGSGTTAVAAIETGRHYVGYDTDPDYVKLAKARIKKSRQQIAEQDASDNAPRRPSLSVRPAPADDDEDFRSRVTREGQAAKEIAAQLLEANGFADVQRKVKLPVGVDADFAGLDNDGLRYYFIVSGAFTSARAGLKRTETLWKALGKAATVAAYEPAARVVLLTTDKPAASSTGGKALAAASTQFVYDVIEMFSREDAERLETHSLGRKAKRRKR